MFSIEQWRNIWFSADECQKQSAPASSVPGMLMAMEYASEIIGSITEENIKTIGFMVDIRNKSGFRKVPVTIDFASIPWENIDRQIRILLAAQRSIDPYEFYQEFESIHPFLDGNSRVGAILFNVLIRSFDSPKIPPEYRRPQ